MSIFITGGTGLVGSHVAEEAVKRGLHVKALARQGSDTKFLEHLGVEIVKGDLADAQSLELGVANCELVINCAAKVGDWGTLEEFRALNVVALEKLLDAMVAAKTKRFVHVSSLGVYEGRDHFGTDETTPPAINSLDAYTRSKCEAENLVLKYHKEKSLPAAVVRPGFIYGERDRTVLPKMLTNMKRGILSYFGSGDQALNCVYVKNLVSAIFLASEKPEAVGEVFNITDGTRISKRDFIGTSAKLAGLKEPTRHIPLKLAWVLALVVEKIARARGRKTAPLINRARYKFLGLNLDYSTEKARKVLGYQPPYTWQEGLKRAIADVAPTILNPHKS
ncbi:MAG: NAD-dependent epimerase/dehydratase family protein [Planctomycetota bacterium]